MYSSTPWSFATKVVFPEPTSPGQAHKLSQEHKDGSQTATACLILLMFYVLTKKKQDAPVLHATVEAELTESFLLSFYDLCLPHI